MRRRCVGNREGEECWRVESLVVVFSSGSSSPGVCSNGFPRNKAPGRARFRPFLRQDTTANGLMPTFPMLSGPDALTSRPESVSADRMSVSASDTANAARRRQSGLASENVLLR